MVFTDPIYVAVRVPANNGSGQQLTCDILIYTYHINQLLDDMTQAQTVELD